MRAAGVGKDFKENPNLRDNWTDAEGYYRKCSVKLGPVGGAAFCLFIDLVYFHLLGECRCEHRGDVGQALRCVWLHWSGSVQQRDQGQGHCQRWPGGGSKDHQKQRAHVSERDFYFIFCTAGKFVKSSQVLNFLIFKFVTFYFTGRKQV